MIKINNNKQNHDFSALFSYFFIKISSSFILYISFCFCHFSQIVAENMFLLAYCRPTELFCL